MKLASYECVLVFVCVCLCLFLFVCSCICVLWINVGTTSHCILKNTLHTGKSTDYRPIHLSFTRTLADMPVTRQCELSLETSDKLTIQ